MKTCDICNRPQSDNLEVREAYCSISYVHPFIFQGIDLCKDCSEIVASRLRSEARHIIETEKDNLSKRGL